MRKMCFLMCLFALICSWLTSFSHASPAPAETVHFCVPLDLEKMQARDSIYAANKQALNLNVGPPRTVRMIHFLPNDRPFRASVVDSIKRTIRQIQTFYGEQMQAHGYGYKTFAFESDASGEPIVHRVEGQQPDSHYRNNRFQSVYDEFLQTYDWTKNIYLIVADISNAGGGAGGNVRKSGGVAMVFGGPSFGTAAHELGHAFGLSHDFRDDAYIMSYGGRHRALSNCSAGFLTVHPYFNREVPIEEDEGEVGPIRERLSSHEYPVGASRAPVRIKVSDSEGCHQVLLFVKTGEAHPGAGFREVKDCRALEGVRDAVIEFDYDGVIPSDGGTSLSNPVRHQMYIEAVDIEGNVGHMRFSLTEVPPNRNATLVHSRRSEGSAFPDVKSVAFSLDGELLASGSMQGTVRTWDVGTGEPKLTFSHERSVQSVAYSPNGRTITSGWSHGVKVTDASTGREVFTRAQSCWVDVVVFSPSGTMLASGCGRAVILWNVATWREIATLVNYSDYPGNVRSVAFSPDGTILASGSGNGKIKLWDVEQYQEIATLETQSDAVLSVAFSPDGKLLASAEITQDPTDYSWDSSVRLYDVETKRDVATIDADTTAFGESYWYQSVAFSPTGAILATGSRDNTVKLWDVETRRKVASFGHSNNTSGGCIGAVHSVAFSPNGTIIASGVHVGNCGGSVGVTHPWTGEVHLWDVSKYTSTPATFSISLDGNAATGDQGITILDVISGSVVPVQLFANNIRGVNGVSARFEYDAAQVGYDGFDPGSLLPNAQVLAVPATNPTAIDISVVSFGGQATADSGLVGSVRFRTTDAFSVTTLRLVSAEVGRGDQRESITPTDIAVTLRLARPSPDFNGDGRVDFGDFVALGMHFGASRGNARYDAKYDLDQDGTIGFGDFLIFGQAFGT